MRQYSDLNETVEETGMSINEMYNAGMWIDLRILIEAGQWHCDVADWYHVREHAADAINEITQITDELDYLNSHH